MLTLRERGYIQIAQMSGMSGPEIIFARDDAEPAAVSCRRRCVGSTSAAILASIGLEVLGLGPFERADDRHDDLLGQLQRRLIRGWWWWWVPPIVVIGVVFIGLFLVAIGLDEVANPRLRRRTV